MWQFSQAIDGIAEACSALGTPITGGNVSFYNETLGKSIYPTPVVGVLGLLDDASHVLKIGFRNPGDVIVLLDAGTKEPSSLEEKRRQFSSSEYAKGLTKKLVGEPPDIDLTAEKRLQDCLIALAKQRAVNSAHDVSDGGIAVTIAESCFASAGLSADVKLDDAQPLEFSLFGERGGRAVISADVTRLAQLVEAARQWGVEASKIGMVTAGPEFRIKHNGKVAIEHGVAVLRHCWATVLEKTISLDLCD